MSYDLTTLLGWTRRAGGDLVTTSTQQLVADGTVSLKINDEGSINVIKVSLTGTVIDSSQYSLDGNVITFSNPPGAGLTVTVTYRRSKYSDDEVMGFLVDGVRGVKADMNLAIVVNDTNNTVDDAPGMNQLYDKTGKPFPRMEQLFVLRGGWAMAEDKGGVAADDAVKIRDGDTSIDTATTAASTAKTIERKRDLYVEALKVARSEGFMGAVDFNEAGPRMWYWGYLF